MAKNEEAEEKDLTVYLDKEPTDLQARFAEWLLDDDIVGYDPAKAKTKEEAFREGVRLAVALRMTFQASPENREANAARKLEREAAEEPEPDERPVKKKRAEEPAPVKSKGKGKSKRAAEPEPDDTEEDEAPRPKKVKASKKKRVEADDTDEAPF